MNSFVKERYIFSGLNLTSAHFVFVTKKTEISVIFYERLWVLSWVMMALKSLTTM